MHFLSSTAYNTLILEAGGL